MLFIMEMKKVRRPLRSYSKYKRNCFTYTHVGKKNPNSTKKRLKATV